LAKVWEEAKDSIHGATTGRYHDPVLFFPGGQLLVFFLAQKKFRRHIVHVFFTDTATTITVLTIPGHIHFHNSSSPLLSFRKKYIAVNISGIVLFSRIHT
jgi:hypothetical protein